jgi:hypothetical protein
LSRAAITVALPASPPPFAVSSRRTGLDPHNGVLAPKSQKALFRLLDDLDVHSFTIGD